MARILALDTSSDACSVALLTAAGVAEDFRVIPRDHTQKILPMVDAILTNAGVKLQELDALAFGCGPGSFTGLRIAAGVVQGLAWGAQLPVIQVSTLASLALQGAQETGAEWVLSLLDARMDEVYAGLYQIVDGVPQLVGEEQVCKPEDIEYGALPEPVDLVVVGSGLLHADRFPASLARSVRVRLADLQPRAGAMLELARHAWQAGQTCTAEAVRPVYLRNEVAWKKLPGRE